MRREAVKALQASDLKFKLYGGGWDKVGIKVTSTGEQHDKNANIREPLVQLGQKRPLN